MLAVIGEFCVNLHNIGCASEEKTNKFILFFSRLSLYLHNIGCASEEITNKFILFFSRLSLYLQIVVVVSHSPTLGMAFSDGARRKYMNICKKTGYSIPKNKGERKLELYTTEYYIIN